MNLPSDVTAAAGKAPVATSHTRLWGRWLLLARGAWLTLVALTLTIFFASLPMYLAQLHTPCAGAACQYQQLTPGQVETLKGIGLSSGDYATYTIVFGLVSMMACLAVSALIVWRRSDDRMALIVALMLVTLGPIIEASDVASGSSPWLVPNECLSLLAQALLVLAFLLFPTGQFVPRWTRWTLVVFLGAEVPLTFFPVGTVLPDTAASQPAWLVALVALAMIALVQIYRYRRVSTPMQRQQTKWVVFGLAVPITISVIGNVLILIFPALSAPGSLYPLVLNQVGFLLPICFPLSLGFAMLRYRLWDIDAIINKALVYGLLTGLLAALYAGLIIGLEALAAAITGKPGQQPVVLVVSTLAIAALFQPVRKRIQALIDRRFYRKKYDAAKTLAKFSAALLNEVDMNELRDHLLTVVEETMQPAHVSLWLRSPDPQEPYKTKL